LLIVLLCRKEWLNPATYRFSSRRIKTVF